MIRLLLGLLLPLLETRWVVRPPTRLQIRPVIIVAIKIEVIEMDFETTAFMYGVTGGRVISFVIVTVAGVIVFVSREVIVDAGNVTKSVCIAVNDKLSV
jgi:hypothetical protein